MIEIGSSIGRYHILEQLGQGGMATVYKAYDTRLENEVALKILRIDAFGSAVLERLAKRFEREAKLMAAMTNRGIVKVTDYGNYNGVPYLVMELLPGGTLKDRMGKPFPYAEAARLAAQVARALNYAHQRQHPILHRDVKPANILVNEEGELVLTDFGIAKILEETDGNTLTGTGVGLGTPEYMAPEQGLGKEVDARADIYALGVVFFELVTGRKPFVADTPLAVLHKQVYDPLPRPRQYVPNLPKSVEQVIFKALAKKPEDRYPDMAAFAAALEGLASSADRPTAGSIMEERRPGNTPQSSNHDESHRLLETEVEATETVDDLPVPPGKKTHSRFWIPAAAIVAGVIGISIWGFGRLSPSPEVAPAITAAPTQITVQPTAPAMVTPTPLQPIEILTTPTSIPTLDFSKLEFTESGTIGTINGIVYSPDGNHFTAATTWGIYIFESATLKEVMKLDIGAFVMKVAYSPDGQLLASGATDKVVKLWNVNTGELLKTMDGGAYPINFSPDGRLLASASANDCFLWDVATGKSMHSLRWCDIVFSPQGGSFAIHKWSKDVIEIWDITSDGIQLSRTLQEIADRNVVFIEENTLAWSFEGDVKMVNTSSGSFLPSLTSNLKEVTFIDIFPDKKTLIFGGYDPMGNYTIELWEVETKTLITSIICESCFAAVSPDIQIIALGSRYGEKINFYNAKTGEQIYSLDGYSQGVSGIVFSPDGLSLITWTEYDRILMWANREN